LTSAANATAAGTIGVANLQAGALSNIGNVLQQGVAQSQSGYGGGPTANTPTWNPATGQEVYS
jgi:hypothetical protein